MKLHRQILQSAIWAMPARQTKVALTILALANWRPSKTWDDGKEIEIPRGSLWTTLPRLAEASEVTVKSVRTALRNLEKTGFIGRQTGRHGQLISVLKYDTYQDADERRAGERAGDGQATGRRRASPPLLEEGEEGEEGKKISVRTPEPPAPERKSAGDLVQTPEAWDLADRLRRVAIENNPAALCNDRGRWEDARPKWAYAIDLLIRRDEAQIAQIRYAIDWLAGPQMRGARFVVESGQALRDKWPGIAREIRRQKYGAGGRVTGAAIAEEADRLEILEAEMEAELAGGGS